MVRQIYPAMLQLNKANTFDTEASFLSPNEVGGIYFWHRPLICTSIQSVLQ